MSVFEINVHATPRGDSYTSGVDFKFTPNPNAKVNYLTNKEGDLEFPSGTGEVTLLFHLSPRIVEWPKGKFEISFLVADAADGKETLWIWHEKGGTRGRYQGSTFSGFALSPDHATNKQHMVLAVTNANEKAQTYQYKLSVGVITPDGIKRISHDPRIINGGSGQN